MNINMNFYSAEVYLEMAKDKVNSQDYDSALASLMKAYTHTRALMDQVLKLNDLKTKVGSTTWEGVT